MTSPNTVALSVGDLPWEYPTHCPFRPGEGYPEFEGRVQPVNERNMVYPLLRDLMMQLGWDAAAFGTRHWNPFSEFISPGQRVLVKPNLVRHLHTEGGDHASVVTQAAVIRCILDYVCLALRGEGTVTVGDAPVQGTDFEELVTRTGLRTMCHDVATCWGMPVGLVDFRLTAAKVDNHNRVKSQSRLAGDLSGYRRVNLGKGSLLMPISENHKQFRVTNYDPTEMHLHHNQETNEYLIPQTVLDADVVINLPKLKTHHKVCLTAGLKNFVGINGHKDWLPHHRACSIAEGGDEYQTRSTLKRFQTHLFETIDKKPEAKLNALWRGMIRVTNRIGRTVFPDPYLEGSWYGNDTLWRTVLDLNRLLTYASSEGTMMQTPQRTCVTIVDGIVAGDCNGPMCPRRRSCGLMVGGANQAAVDAVLATVIGFDYRRIPMITNAFGLTEWPIASFGPDEIEIRSNDPELAALRVGMPCDRYQFVPPTGWKGHVEMMTPAVEASNSGS